MQLLYSPTSPYARKIRALIRELDIADRVDEVAVAPLDNPQALAINPLMKVPTLVVDRETGEAIYDSPVIAAYLCQMPSRQLMIPVEGDAHWKVRTTEALCDGILDAAIGLRIEAAGGGSGRNETWPNRFHSAISRGLSAIPARLAPLEAHLHPDDAFSYAHLCTVVVLDYLDFRFGHIDWRQNHTELAALHDRWAGRPSLVETRPAE